MIKKNSIYSLNKKNPDAIVYPSATGKPVFVTREDFPNEEEFLAFKKWSDENFHSEEKHPTAQSPPKTYPMRLLPLPPSTLRWRDSRSRTTGARWHQIWSSSSRTS